MVDGKSLRLVTGVTHDVCDQEQALPGWTQDYRQLEAGRFAGAVSEVAAPGIRVFRETTNLRLQQHTAPPPDTIVLGIPLPGSAPSRFQGKPVGDGDILVFSSTVPSEFLCFGLMNVIAVCIDCTFVREMGMTLPALAELGGNGAFFSPLALDLRDWLCRFMGAVSAETGRSGDPGRNGVFQRSVWDRCVGVLEELQNAGRTGGEPMRPPVPPQRHAIVKQAREYVRAHPDDLLSVAQIAQALKVSTRMLEYCFADVVGVSPNVYLRMIRLNAARRELLGADPRSTTVAEVAMNHGFWHLGRFSTYYCAMFGEKPSDTLRQLNRPPRPGALLPA